MGPGRFRFERFVLDPGDRLLSRDGAPVELNARYFDALALLVREQGRLVSKERFLDDVWRGVPVTDEALTQCIRTIRRQLGDEAGNPRFIETVPKHGYRFIAPVESGDGVSVPAVRVRPTEARASHSWSRIFLLGGAGSVGGGFAGVFGGLFYGLAGASRPLQPGMGEVSILLVLICLTMLVGLLGGAGVGLGIAAARLVPARTGVWNVVGGALGGMLIGGFIKLLGLDAFNLLFGQSPGEITGAPEGMLLGGAVGLGVWLGARAATGASVRPGVAVAGLAGASAGVFITLAGGRLMAGSLDLLDRRFPDSRLNVDQIGALFGETGFGTVSQAATGALEGLLFCACVAGAMLLAQRRWTTREDV